MACALGAGGFEFEAHWPGVLRLPTSFLSGLLLEFDPNTVRTPVAAPLVFAPPILVVVGPLPIVAINVEPEVGLVVVFLLNMPAVTVVIANNGRRGTCRRESQSADDS
jgi:hypothetical protein